MNNKLLLKLVHDLRSPLSSLELLAKRFSVIEEQKYMLFIDAVRDLRDIVNKLEKNAILEST
jgi:hypothetical protein